MERNYSVFSDKFNIEVNKRHFIIKNAIWFLFIFLLFMVTMIKFKRIVVFIKIFDSTSDIGFTQIAGIIIYFIALLLCLSYFISIFTYIAIKEYKNIEWYNTISKISASFDLLNFVLKTITIMMFIFIFLINPCRVSGASMNDTFYDGDRIIVTPIASNPDNDDIIIFDAKNYNDSENEAFYIKRVVAKEGDYISYIAGELYINDVKDGRGNVTINQYNYLVSSIMEFDDTDDGSSFKHRIPNNKILVLGDNRLNSYDSRKFGLVDVSDVYGKVILRFYPFNLFSFFW